MAAIPLNKAAIAAMIPHAGGMCLLDGVLDWDAQKICCVSRSHRNAGNPLRSDGQLAALCGIEYAAQAMAVHGGLSGVVGGKPKGGYLASLREVTCHVERLDNLQDDLVIDAERLMGDESRVIYAFTVRAGKVDVLSGRATVVLDVG